MFFLFFYKFFGVDSYEDHKGGVFLFVFVLFLFCVLLLFFSCLQYVGNCESLCLCTSDNFFKSEFHYRSWTVSC